MDSSYHAALCVAAGRLAAQTSESTSRPSFRPQRPSRPLFDMLALLSTLLAVSTIATACDPGHGPHLFVKRVQPGSTEGEPLLDELQIRVPEG